MEPNCPSPCGSMLPSAPSALCRWRAGRPLQPQQRQALGSTYCHLGVWELTGPRRPSGDQSGCSWMAEPSPHSSKHLAGTRQHPSVTFSAGLPPRACQDMYVSSSFMKWVCCAASDFEARSGVLGFREGRERSHGCRQLDPPSLSRLGTSFPWERKKCDMRCWASPKPFPLISLSSVLNS